MNELTVVVNQVPGTITTNFDDIKASLTEQMQVYKELEVTADNKTERKKDIATLRKMQKAVSSKFTEVKKEFMAPLDQLKVSVDEVNSIIAEPIQLLNSQVAEFEDKQRVEKKAAIEEYFSSVIGDLSDDIVLDRIYDDKWENVTTSMKSVKADIDSKLSEIRNNVTLIKSMNSEKSEEALTMYYDNLNVTSAIAMINRYEQQKREIEERMKQEQEQRRERELERERERVREEERRRIREEEERSAKIREEEKAKAEQELREQQEAEKAAMEVQRQEESANMVTKSFKVTGTEQELNQVAMYLDSIGVQFIIQ